MQSQPFSQKSSRLAGQSSDRELWVETWTLTSGDKTLPILKGPDAVVVFIDDPDNQQFALVVQPRPACGIPRWSRWPPESAICRPRQGSRPLSAC
jgi:hypothetical protein